MIFPSVCAVVGLTLVVPQVLATVARDENGSREYAVAPSLLCNVTISTDENSESICIVGQREQASPAQFDCTFLLRELHEGPTFAVRTLLGLSVLQSKVSIRIDDRNLKVANSDGSPYPRRQFFEFAKENKYVLMKYEFESFPESFVSTIAKSIPIITLPSPTKGFPNLHMDKTEMKDKVLKPEHKRILSSLGLEKHAGVNDSPNATRPSLKVLRSAYRNDAKLSDERRVNSVIPWLITHVTLKVDGVSTFFSGEKIISREHSIPYPVLTTGGESGIGQGRDGELWIVSGGERVEVRYLDVFPVDRETVTDVEAKAFFPTGEPYPVNQLKKYLDEGRAVYATQDFQEISHVFLSSIKRDTPILKLLGPHVSGLSPKKIFSIPTKMEN